MALLEGPSGAGKTGIYYKQDRIFGETIMLVPQVRSSEHTPLLTALLEGPAGAGKTALAATLGLESQFPFVKVVSSDAMVGFSEPAKAAQIAKVFEDAYRVRGPTSMYHWHCFRQPFLAMVGSSKIFQGGADCHSVRVRFSHRRICLCCFKFNEHTGLSLPGIVPSICLLKPLYAHTVSHLQDDTYALGEYLPSFV